MTLPLRDSRMSQWQSPGNPPPWDDVVAKRPRVPNFVLMGVTIIFLLVSVPAIYLWHALQIASQADIYLKIAKEAEEKEDWFEAERLLRSYQSLVPDDREILARLGRAIDLGAWSDQTRLRAIPFYAHALSIDPSRNDLRIRMAQLHLADNPDAAYKIAEEALLVEPQNSAALEVRGAALHRRLDPQAASLAEVKTATAALTNAFEKNPKSIETAVRLADIYTHYASLLAADERVGTVQIAQRTSEIMDAMVKRNPDKARAFMTRYQYLRTTGQRPELMDADVKRAMQLDPTDPAVRFAAAQAILDMAFHDPLAIAEQGRVDDARLEEAEGHLRVAMQSSVHKPTSYVGLAYIEMMRGNREEAIRTIEAGLTAADSLHPMLNVWLASLLLQTEAWEEADEAITRLDEVVDSLREVRESAEESKRYAMIARILRAAWYIADRNPKRSYIEASQVLQNAQKNILIEGPIPGADIRRAQIYAAMNQWDVAADEYQAASIVTPQSSLPLFGRADALRRSGRFRAAIDAYRRGIELSAAVNPMDPSAVWADMARAQLGELLGKAEDQRKWDEFDSTVGKIIALSPQSLMPIALQLEEGLIRGRPEDVANVARLLSESQRQHEKDPRYWDLAAEVHLRLGQVEEAEAAVDRLESITQKPNERLRERLRNHAAKIGATSSWPYRTPEDMVRGLAWSVILQQLPGRESRLFANSSLMSNETGSQTIELSSYWAQGLAAASRRDLVEMARCQDALETIEGPDGTFWKFLQIQTYLIRAQTEGIATVDLAADLCQYLHYRRPNWCMTLVADGMIAEAQGRVADAIRAYARGVGLGDQSAETRRRILGLRILSREDSEAWGELQQLPREMLLDPQLLAIAVQLFLKHGRTVQATALAEDAAARYSHASEAQTLIGLSLLAANRDGDLEVAEAALQAGVELAPGDLYAYSALLFLYSSRELPGGPVKSLATLRQINEMMQVTEAAIPLDRLAYLIASGYHGIGDFRNAEPYWRKAIQKGRTELLAPQAPTGAYVSLSTSSPTGKVDSAALEEIPDHLRRMIGMVLVASLASADQDLGAKLLAHDPRAHVIALAARGGPGNRQQSITLMRQIPQEEWTGNDHELVASLLLADGRVESAIEHLKKAGPRSRPKLADLLLRAGKWEQASQLLDAMASESVDALVLEPLRMRWLDAQGQTTEAFERARNYVTQASPDSSTQTTPAIRRRAQTAATWLTAMGQPLEGTKLLRSVAGEELDGLTDLAEGLAQQPGGMLEAIRLCLTLAQRDPSQGPAQLMARLVTLGPIDAAQANACETLLQRRSESDPGNENDLLASLATLRERQGKTEEAAELTREALEKDPTNTALLRKSAWLLTAYSGNHDAALETAQRLMKSAGAKGPLLDTLGIALLEQKQYAAAIRVLETRVSDPDASAASYLHLAEAYRSAGSATGSKRALAHAKALGLDSLVPRDRQALAALETTLGAAKK